jgi:serine/threonine protein kinase
MKSHRLHRRLRSIMTLKPPFKTITTLQIAFWDSVYELPPSYFARGSFSCVYLGIERETDRNVAIKVVKKLGNTKPDMLKNEIEILLKVHHENIISCLDLFETEDKLFIVMELYVIVLLHFSPHRVTGGELFDRVVLRDQYSEWEAKIVSRQVFSALKYLHSNGIVHRDLKVCFRISMKLTFT